MTGGARLHQGQDAHILESPDAQVNKRRTEPRQSGLGFQCLRHVWHIALKDDGRLCHPWASGTCEVDEWQQLAVRLT